MIDPKKLLNPNGVSQETPTTVPEIAGAQQTPTNVMRNAQYTGNDPAQQQPAGGATNPVTQPTPQTQGKAAAQPTVMNPGAYAPAVAQPTAVVQPAQQTQYRQQGSGFINPEAFGIGRTFAVNQGRVTNPLGIERQQAVDATQSAIEAARSDWRDDVASQNLSGLFVDGADAMREAREFGDMRALADTAGGQAQLLGSRTAGGGRLDAAAFQADREAQARLRALKELSTADDIAAANAAIRQDALGEVGGTLEGLEGQLAALDEREAAKNAALENFLGGVGDSLGSENRAGWTGREGTSPEAWDQQYQQQLDSIMRDVRQPSEDEIFDWIRRHHGAAGALQAQKFGGRFKDEAVAALTAASRQQAEAQARANTESIMGIRGAGYNPGEQTYNYAVDSNLANSLARSLGLRQDEVRQALGGVSGTREQVEAEVAKRVEDLRAAAAGRLADQRTDLTGQQQGWIDFRRLLEGTNF